MRVSFCFLCCFFLCARLEVHCIPPRVYNGIHKPGRDYALTNPAGTMHLQTRQGLCTYNPAGTMRLILLYNHSHCFSFFLCASSCVCVCVFWCVFFRARALMSIVYPRGYTRHPQTRQGLCTYKPGK